MIQSYLALRKTLCIDIRKENLDICWCEAVDADIPKFPIRLQPTKRNIMRQDRNNNDISFVGVYVQKTD